MTSLALSEAGQSVVAGTFGRAMKRAGEAMGSMSGQVIEVQTPMLRRCTAAEVMAMAGGAESVVLAVYLGITGSLTGHSLPGRSARPGRVAHGGKHRPAGVR